MSLESKIEDLTNVIVALNANIVALLHATPSPQAPAPSVAPLLPVPEPTPMALPQQPAPAPQMPAPPSFMTPPVQAAPTVPFSDTKGLITYMTQAYGALGPEKGAQMQNVLTNFGYGNVNDVKPEHFPAIFQAIEALKA